MKRLSNAVLSLLLPIFVCCVTFTSTTNAAEVATLYSIPDRYALLTVTGVEATAPLDTKKLSEILSEEFNKSNVEYMQMLVYDKGKKFGDGARAFNEKIKGRDEIPSFMEIPTNKPGAKEISLLAEKSIGYPCSPIELWQLYEDNEVVADEDFKDKPLIVEFQCQGVSKDAFGKAYINVPVDPSGLFGLYIYIDMKDPNLRKIKRGDTITVQAFPQKFLIRSVHMNGNIIFVEK